MILAHLTWMVCKIRIKWLLHCYFLWGTTSRIYSKLHIVIPISFFSLCVSLESRWCSHTVVLTWLQLKRISILFYQIDQILTWVDNRYIAIYVLPMHMLTSPSVNEIFLLRYMNWSINFRGLQFNEAMAPSWLKYMNSILSEFT